MTTVAVLADPPAESRALRSLVEAGLLDPAEATDLYTAGLRDACRTVERSGGDLLVNFRTHDLGDDAEAAVRDALAPALEAPEEARFEVQVGSSRSARVGNTVTHLLEREGVRSAAVLDPVATLVERRHVDSAAMKLRQSEVVLGPSAGGRVWYAAFAEPVDFTGAMAPPALPALADRGREADLDVDFTERLPRLDGPAELASAVAEVRARVAAEKLVPPYTAEAVAELGLDAAETDDSLAVVRE
jgi:hypothetical protein